MASHGPQTATYLGTSARSRGALGRCLPSNACKSPRVSSSKLALTKTPDTTVTAVSCARRRNSRRRWRGPRRVIIVHLVHVATLSTFTLLRESSVRPCPTFTRRPSPDIYFFFLRLPRATATQESSRLNQKIFHLHDGPEQRERDEGMRAAMHAELDGQPIPDGNPNQWADRTKSKVQFDYDAYAEVDRWWSTGGGREHIEALAEHPTSSLAPCASSPSSSEVMMKSRL
jgi:hypothetical protein